MAEGMTELDASAERFHPHDPDVEHWNESWLVSWLPADGRGAGLFRLGVLPNQGRAWLWLWLWTGEEWVTIEETRLDAGHLDRTRGVAYDRWGLAFAYDPVDPLHRGRFAISGVGRVQGGRRAGRLVPFSVELAITAVTPCFATGAGHDEGTSSYPASRFEQSVTAQGTVVVGGSTTAVSCPAHRDRSWGPRTWEYGFMLGDLQSPETQVYFGAGPHAEGGVGKGYVRSGERIVELARIEADVAYDDEAATFDHAVLTFHDADGGVHRYALEALAPSVQFDMAHAADPPRHWLYWRTLVRATPADGGEPMVGWFEANRFPRPGPVG